MAPRHRCSAPRPRAPAPGRSPRSPTRPPPGVVANASPLAQADRAIGRDEGAVGPSPDLDAEAALVLLRQADALLGGHRRDVKDAAVAPTAMADAVVAGHL